MTDKPRLIERAFPLKQTSLASVHEKNVRHGHISTLHIWPARRPLAACRAALLATLLPDPGTPEERRKLCERIGGTVVKTIEWKKMPNGQVVERDKDETTGGVLRWIGMEPKSGGKEKIEQYRKDLAFRESELAWFREEIKKAYGGRMPRVLDPFAGGGAIPLEAMRLGCETTAVDINPVAWFILKCTLEYPQKLAGKTYPLPDFILEDERFMEAFYKAHPHLVGRTKKTKKEKSKIQQDLWDKKDSFSSQLDWIARCIDVGLEAAKSAVAPEVINRSAIQSGTTLFDAIVTDPPYYDAIPYSDCMDFFYVWIKRITHETILDQGDGFMANTSPKWNHEEKDGELIDDDSRHGGNATVSKQSYEDGMARAFIICEKSLHENGRLIIVFAHKHPNAWETLVSAIIKAGFIVDGSWPIQTEMGTRMRAMSSAALSSSVWLVCKKRPITARPGWDNKVLEQMRANISEQLRDYWDAGIRGPDFVWAATGPALEAYSKHPVVKKANTPGEVMAVSEFLSHVRRMVVDFVVGQVLTGEKGGPDTVPVDRMDSPTAYYLLHRHDFGLDEAPAGACILYATACGLSDRDLESAWDLVSHKGNVSSIQDGDESSDPDDETESEENGDSGSKIKLKTWTQRNRQTMGYEAPSGRPIPLIDRVHRLMHLWRAGDVHKVDAYLEDNGLRRQELFNRLVQSMIELSTASSEERSLLESLSNHVQAKISTVSSPQKGLAFSGNDITQ